MCVCAIMIKFGIGRSVAFAFQPKIISAPSIIRINIIVAPIVSGFIVSSHIIKMRVAIKK